MHQCAGWSRVMRFTAGLVRYLGRALRYLCLLGLLLAASTGLAQTGEPPAGVGSVSDPYQIGTLSHLVWLSTNSAKFTSLTYCIQIAHIDAAESASWPMGFKGISTQNNPNRYVLKMYDGQGYTVSNLVMRSYAATPFENKGFFPFLLWRDHPQPGAGECEYRRRLLRRRGPVRNLPLRRRSGGLLCDGPHHGARRTRGRTGRVQRQRDADGAMLGGCDHSRCIQRVLHRRWRI